MTLINQSEMTDAEGMQANSLYGKTWIFPLRIYIYMKLFLVETAVAARKYE